MKEYWVYESSFSNLLNLLRERALTAARRNKFDEVIVELKESLLKEGKVFISPELADKIKKIIPDKYLQFVMEYDASYDDADADDGDGDSDNDNGAADTDADDGDGDGDGHADDGDADADDSDGDGGDEADVGADSGADDGNDGQSSKVGLAIVIVIAVAITFAMFIWYGVMAKKIKTANNSTPQATTQTITPTQAPTAKPTQKPTQVSTQAPAELPTFKGVAATEKTTEKAKSQQTQQAQKKVQIPQQRIVVEEYVVAETPQQSYIPEPTPTPSPSPSLSPSPQPEEEINSSRDSTVDEGVTGGNEGYGASISGQVESPVPEKIFEAEHPLPPAITQEEIEDISPVVLTPAS